MNDDHALNSGAPYVQLFQKAHQKIVALDRFDEQISQIVARRQEALEELRVLQTQINRELEDRIHARGESAAQLLASLAGHEVGSAKGAASAGKARDAGTSGQNRLVAEGLMSLSADAEDSREATDEDAVV
jgi:hypothetical protein